MLNFIDCYLNKTLMNNSERAFEREIGERNDSMSQVLKINVPIQIPEKYRLVENSEYTKLQVIQNTHETCKL